MSCIKKHHICSKSWIPCQRRSISAVAGSTSVRPAASSGRPPEMSYFIIFAPLPDDCLPPAYGAFGLAPVPVAC